MQSPSSLSKTDIERQISRLTEIGIALSAELNLDALLEKTLHYARELTHADAGTLYLLEDGRLRFRIMQNASLGLFRSGNAGREIELEPVPLEKANVSARAVLEGRTIRVEDVYASSEYDFSGPRRYDSLTGYRSRSMLAAPMKTRDGDTIGALQLINAIDESSGRAAAFGDSSVALAEALASQAAVAISNARLVEEITALFDSLIRVLAVSIDRKSPYTGNHVQRVAAFNVLLANYISQKEDGEFAGVRFSEKEIEAIRLAGWLHDIGKVVTPVHIMDKSAKLETVYDRIGVLEERFEAIRLSFEREALEARLALPPGAGSEEIRLIDERLRQRIGELESDLAFLRQCNRPREAMGEEDARRVEQIAAKTYRGAEEAPGRPGAEKPYLTADEKENLLVRRGTLTEAEIAIMRQHAAMTARMLEHVEFRRHLKDVPRIAAQHHEKLDGTGYPLGLTAKDLSLASRILAVADLYDSLSADDRPYKKPLPEEQVLAIMEQAAEAGEIDRRIFDLLKKDGVHRLFEDAMRNKAGERG